MKTLNNWQETLEYVNRIGVANPTMPIGWRQQVLMDNVNLIEGLSINKYPIAVKYSRVNDEFTVNHLTVKASHR